jgi:predicted phage baseplate assembly protein
LSWLGINAVAVDQRRTMANLLAGQSDGGADQVVKLPAESVDPDTLAIEVYESGRGFVPWTRVEDLGERGRDERAYALDGEAGTLTFGNGVAGKVPEPGARIRIVRLRAGGGAAGNLAAGALAGIQQARLTCRQPAPTTGGADAETLDAAERRITAVLRHQNRCVTADDYRALAAEMDLARVEVLPRFRPFQRRFDSPGTVSVLVLPGKAVLQPPNPRPDRPLIERVKAHLDARRPLSTELYAIGAEYRKLGLAIAIGIRDGFAREEVVKAVKQAAFAFLWPLAPGGRDGAGWPLGEAVNNLEVEVVVARVPGVRTTQGVNLFVLEGDAYTRVPTMGSAQRLALEPWQLPELMRVEVAVDAAGPAGSLADELSGGPGAVAIPVVPETC